MEEITRIVHRRLAELELQEDVKILLAVESGSRAWGFPSADSDYDVRFLYVHRPEWYLSIDQGRDVIERPLDEHDLDLSGWDLRKALGLLRKSNPPLLEWLLSPIIYREYSSIATQMRTLSTSIHSPRASFHHYLSMAKGNYREYLQRDVVRVKKYFYVLRPVLACLWIERGMGIVPMEFRTLLETIIPQGEVRSEIESLLEKKQRGEELDEGKRIEVLNQFLDSEISRLATQTTLPKPDSDQTESLNRLFREGLQEAWVQGS